VWPHNHAAQSCKAPVTGCGWVTQPSCYGLQRLAFCSAEMPIHISQNGSGRRAKQPDFKRSKAVGERKRLRTLERSGVDWQGFLPCWHSASLISVRKP